MSESALSVGPSSDLGLVRPLPSGRSLVLKVIDGREELDVRSAAGELEVRIAFEATGPVVTVRGGRLELAGPEVAVTCDRFTVDAAKGVQLRSAGDVAVAAQGELRAQANGDVRMNGAFIRLNCTE